MNLTKAKNSYRYYVNILGHLASMDNTLSASLNSSSNFLPQIEEPPFPVPVGSPV